MDGLYEEYSLNDECYFKGSLEKGEREYKGELKL
jgi:hypothetical protein